MMRTLIVAPILIAASAPQRYELVARWPDAPQSNYTRVYPSKGGCEKAVAAIQDEYNRRKIASRYQTPSGGTIYAPPAQPIVVCVPI